MRAMTMNKLVSECTEEPKEDVLRASLSSNIHILLNVFTGYFIVNPIYLIANNVSTQNIPPCKSIQCAIFDTLLILYLL